jgi:hypothetical protein
MFLTWLAILSRRTILFWIRVYGKRLFLIVFLGIGGCAEREVPVFQRSALETPSIKDLPSADVLSVRVSIVRKDTWSLAHRAAMFYFTHSNIRMYWPVFLVLPDETGRAEDEWLFLLPDQGAKLPDPEEVAERFSARQLQGIQWSLKRLDSLTVAAYRVNQKLSYSAIRRATEVLYAEGKKRSWRLLGKPRYAVFTNPRVTPFFMQAFEVQIPILER